MVSRAFGLIFPLFGIYLISFVQGTDDSYCNDPSYALLRTCAAECFGCSGSNDRIAIAIGCGAYSQNECFCNTDLFSLATSGLGYCISKSCTVGGWEGDYSSAEHVYTNYCEGAGFTIGGKAPATAAATITVTAGAPTVNAQTSAGTLNIGGYGGPTATFTSTNSDSSSGNSGGKYLHLWPVLLHLPFQNSLLA